MPTRALIGTCATRLAFANNGLPDADGDLPLLRFDFERTSIISLISQPWVPDPAWLPPDLPAHERRWIEQDFRKDFWGLYLPVIDFLYLDFLGDRLTVVERHDQRSAFKQLCLSSRTNPAVVPANYILYRCPENGQADRDGYLSLCENAFYAFVYKVKALNPRCRILVHAFTLAKVCDDGQPVPPHEIERYTGFYDHIHAVAQASPLVRCVTPAVPAIAQRGHAYGEAPQHLTSAYYRALADQILAFEASHK
jgi:hypothetical protein